jgi:hypothetical protein
MDENRINSVVNRNNRGSTCRLQRWQRWQRCKRVVLICFAFLFWKKKQTKIALQPLQPLQPMQALETNSPLSAPGGTRWYHVVPATGPRVPRYNVSASKILEVSENRGCLSENRGCSSENRERKGKNKLLWPRRERISRGQLAKKKLPRQKKQPPKDEAEGPPRAPQLPTFQNAETLLHALTASIKNQDPALKVIADKVHDVLKSPTAKHKPILILMPGPTGTGKTATALNLAAALDVPCLKLGMNTYTESRADTLFGGSAELVGHDTPAPLPDFFAGERLKGEKGEKPTKKHRPLAPNSPDRPIRGVVILDEIEKAHSSVLKRLMSFIDSGEERDSANRVLDAHNVIFLAPSNACSSLIARTWAKMNQDKEILDKDEAHRSVVSSVREPVKLRICGPDVSVGARVKAIAVFNSLDNAAINAIVQSKLGGIIPSKVLSSFICSTVWDPCTSVRSLDSLDCAISALGPGDVKRQYKYAGLSGRSKIVFSVTEDGGARPPPRKTSTQSRRGTCRTFCGRHARARS